MLVICAIQSNLVYAVVLNFDAAHYLNGGTLVGIERAEGSLASLVPTVFGK